MSLFIDSNPLFVLPFSVTRLPLNAANLNERSEKNPLAVSVAFQSHFNVALKPHFNVTLKPRFQRHYQTHFSRVAPLLQKCSGLLFENTKNSHFSPKNCKGYKYFCMNYSRRHPYEILSISLFYCFFLSFCRRL